MIRILLPLAIIAAILFAPMYSISGMDPVTNETSAATKSGYGLVKNTIDCWRSGEYSLADKCAPVGGLKGQAVFAAVFVSAVAAVLGILGLLPVIGRLTSLITTLAGIIVIAAIGYFALTTMGSKNGGSDAIQWGTYLAGGGGLLTLISGLHGVRGRG